VDNDRVDFLVGGRASIDCATCRRSSDSQAVLRPWSRRGPIVQKQPGRRGPISPTRICYFVRKQPGRRGPISPTRTCYLVRMQPGRRGPISPTMPVIRAEAAGPTRTYKPNGDLLFAYRTTLHNRRSEDCLSAADTFLTSATTRQLAAAARPTRRFPFKFYNVFFSSSFTPVWTQRSSKRTSAVLSSNNNN
jgi:hypothetical protein